MPTLREIAGLRRLLDDLSRLSVTNLRSAWMAVGDMEPRRAEAVLVSAFPDIVTPYSASAAEAASVWYGDLAPDEDFLAAPADPPPADQLEASARWATGPIFTDRVAVLDRLSQSAERHIFNGARDTLSANAETEGVGWARHASANACAFCRMLATRGAVYWSEEAAGRVVGRGRDMSLADRRARAAGRTRVARGRFAARGRRPRGDRDPGQQYHDHCHCLPVPVRAGDFYESPPYVDEWERQYIEATIETPGTGPYGAIDTKAVLAHMRAQTREGGGTRR